ncbi:hypothetical protein [Streptomyces chrestomyceticus]|uniref:hypothetical protein n=1 Tax=Streptomyces chrestomyceticus TaxID=68185 RepID=UPI001FD13530|nr:hypothetical protein [Streptomyces chrestomyceticus]
MPAVSSPIECPTSEWTDVPRRQQPEQRHLDGEEAGWAKAVSVTDTGPGPAACFSGSTATAPRLRAPRLFGQQQLPNGPPERSSKWAQTSSRARANSGNAAYHSRAMPIRCAPWPVKRKHDLRARSPCR